MDQCADGRGAFHGVREPDVKRKLRGFAAGAGEEKQAGDGEGAEDAPGFVGPRCGFREELREVQCAESFEEQKHAEHEAEVADAVDDECFFAGVRCGFFQKIKADEQIAGEADAFPSDEEENVIGGEDEDEHEEHEEVEVGKEAVVAAFVRHVAGGIDVNEEADAGDDENHDHGQLVHLEVEARAEKIATAYEIGNCDPVEEFLVNKFLALFEEFADGFERGGKGEARGGERDGVDDFVRPVFAEKAVDCRAEEGQSRDDPENVEYRRRH